MSTRKERLRELGHTVGAAGLTVAFTDGVEGPAAKRARHCEKASPLESPEAGEQLLAETGPERNPVLVCGSERLRGGRGLLGVNIDGPQARALFRSIAGRYGLPPTWMAQSGRQEGVHFFFGLPEGHDAARFDVADDGT